MEVYAIRTLRAQPLRLALTVGGVALCVILMLFLISVYKGVADGSVEYIRQNHTDLWVLQRSATNILRGSSFVTASQEESIRELPNVKSVSPVLLILAAVQKNNKQRTVFLTGYDTKKGIGGPPQLALGRDVQRDDEIVLDRSFAAKFRFNVGDTVYIQEHRMRVVGISRGTNAFVIQYAFVTLGFTRKLVGFPGIATCFMVETYGQESLGQIAQQIRKKVRGVEVYTHLSFLKNNIQEMESGFLPLLYTVAAIGGVVLTVILSLLLSVNILERRKDFAVLKTLGAPGLFLKKLIIEQALLISSGASLAALTFFFPLVYLIGILSPEVSVKSTLGHVIGVIIVVQVMSIFSAIISIQKLRQIYILEVFR